MLELAEELQHRGHSVTVITTWPEYNLDQDQDKKSFNGFENENGIAVIRVKTLPHHNVNYIVRGLSQLLMPVQFLLKLRKYKIKSEAVVVYSPPLPLALVGSWLRRKGVRNLLNVQDLFPQNAIDLGILTSKLQIKFFQAMERYAYHTADIVTVHSAGNRKMVLQQHPELHNKLCLLHNWVDIDHHANDHIDQHHVTVDFRKKWSITQKHVAVFAGVMGPSQYLELIIHVAEQLQDIADLLFLFVGDGKEKEKLVALTQEKNLKNVRFEGFISRDVFPDLLAMCSVGLVCLSPQNKTPVVPGKILGHMAAGIPVVAFLHTASDGHQLIKDAQCGISGLSENWDDCALSLRQLISNSDQFNEIGRRGKIFAIKHFSKQKCVEELESMLLKD